MRRRPYLSETVWKGSKENKCVYGSGWNVQAMDETSAVGIRYGAIKPIFYILVEWRFHALSGES